MRVGGDLDVQVGAQLAARDSGPQHAPEALHRGIDHLPPRGLVHLGMRLRLHQHRGGDGRVDPRAGPLEHRDEVRTRVAGGDRPGAFDGAFLLTRSRSEFAMTAIPAPARRVVFPLQVLLGRVLRRYARFADAPGPGRAQFERYTPGPHDQRP